MLPAVSIRPANPNHEDVVSSILLEAVKWLQERGTPMWRDNEMLPARIRDDVAAGLFVLALVNGEPAGTLKFQLSDPLFWPEMPDDGAYVPRLAVRRAFAGKGISSELLRWAAARASALGRRFLRLDCEAARPRLRAFYERFGFRHHSDREVPPYFVARYELPLAPAG